MKSLIRQIIQLLASYLETKRKNTEENIELLDEIIKGVPKFDSLLRENVELIRENRKLKEEITRQKEKLAQEYYDQLGISRRHDLVDTDS